MEPNREPTRLHPVTFFDQQPATAIEDGVADFRPYYEAVPLAARMGPPSHPGVRPAEDTAEAADVDPEKKGPAPD